MKKFGKSDIIRILKEEYESHLLSNLQELKLFNSQGDLIVGKDLKVKHKPSGYIYTVKGVKGEPGDARVVLRSPEEPRIDPALAKGSPIEPVKIPHVKVPHFKREIAEDEAGDEEKESKKDYGKKAYPKPKQPPEEDSGDTMFVIDQEEFEKYYEEA